MHPSPASPLNYELIFSRDFLFSWESLWPWSLELLQKGCFACTPSRYPHQSWFHFTLIYWFGEFCTYIVSTNLGPEFLRRGHSEPWSERKFSHCLSLCKYFSSSPFIEGVVLPGSQLYAEIGYSSSSQAGPRLSPLVLWALKPPAPRAYIYIHIPSAYMLIALPSCFLNPRRLTFQREIQSGENGMKL